MQPTLGDRSLTLQMLLISPEKDSILTTGLYEATEDHQR